MLQAAAAGPLGWEDGLEDRAVNSPANCLYRALKRMVPDEFDGAELWKASVFAANGLYTLFNRLDATELLDKLFPEGDYWQKVLRYCEAGNLQAVLDEYIFQLRSQQAPGEITTEQLWSLADDILAHCRSSRHRCSPSIQMRLMRICGWVSALPSDIATPRPTTATATECPRSAVGSTVLSGHSFWLPRQWVRKASTSIGGPTPSSIGTCRQSSRL